MTKENLLISKHPLLNFIHNNQFMDDTIKSLTHFTTCFEQHSEIVKVWKFFEHRDLQLAWLDNHISGYLIDVENLKDKAQLLKSSPQETGVIFLNNPIYPVFSEVPEYIKDINAQNYPVNTIVYSWLDSDEHSKLQGYYDPKAPNPPNDRDLLILPFFENTLTLMSDIFHVTSPDEIYGWEYEMAEGRGWYGNILDFVMSYIIFYNYFDDLETPLPRTSNFHHDRTLMTSGSNKIEIFQRLKGRYPPTGRVSL
ncbi:hypothetical protein AWW67_15140 [Roseivirga seohaensis]|uniref:Uncharacterized protein n=2 Tax=Roseivirga seohaensis TaxID=1914963 RepID=A0A150Y3G5_9BACT|nr:hypothetical protein AWW67_15140 [Roseivirga seohaensis]